MPDVLSVGRSRRSEPEREPRCLAGLELGAGAAGGSAGHPSKVWELAGAAH